MKFEALHLPTPILNALREQGYETPTPIQEQAIPPAMAGRDVLGCARTGTGKTCAFAVPILTRLSKTPNKRHPIRALVLTPTRELAIQNQDCFAAYGAHLPLRSTVIFGGVGQAPQVEALQKGTDILVATPGRLADLYQQGHIDLTQLEIFVLDEADRMLDMGFIHDVRRILKWLPAKKQTLFFSATMPDEVQKLVDQLLHDPVRIAVDPVNSTVDAIDQHLCRTDKSKKIKLLVWLLSREDYPSVLVFTRTKHGANRVARDLERAGITAAAIHGNKSQTARQAALAAFKAGELRVLVATDIAARGLDIEGLSCVVNYNLPDVPETYVHRIGRTGRAGQNGIAYSFCDASEQEELRAIQKTLGHPIPEIRQHPYPMEETEVSMTDQRGRRINPEDAEARAAAQEHSRKRRNKPDAAEDLVPETPSADVEAAERVSAPQSGSESRKSRNKSKPAPQPESKAQKSDRLPIDKEVIPPEEDVGDYSDWLRHRANTRPPERRPYSPDILDELLALPDFADELGYDQVGKLRPRKPHPLSSGKVMDATARMFLKGLNAAALPREWEPIPEKGESAPRTERSESRRSRRERRSAVEEAPAPAPAPAPARQEKPKRAKAEPAAPKAESASAPKPEAAAPAPESGESTRSGRHRRRHERGGRNKAEQAPAKAETAPKAEAAPKQESASKAEKGEGSGRAHHRSRNRRGHRDHGHGNAANAAAPQAEGGKSLVRPYYISDQKGKH